MAKPVALPEPGDLVGGKYRVERKLGSGAMGAVYEVTHRVTNKHFAVKWLLPDVAVNDGAVKRFIREAQVAGRFVHPNVIEIYDLGQDDGSFYMVMELLSGETLAERLRRAGRLSTQEACEILVPCMEGVAAAHAAGIIHRDLKPANIFVCAARGRSPEEPKVLDFGVSKLAAGPGLVEATLTQAGALIGTPQYMAPEQLRAQPVDARADIYAFGVILYEVLSGRRPFEATGYADLVLQVLNESARPLRERARDLPAGVAAAVTRAMARDREARFPELSQLVAALQPYYRTRSYAKSSQPSAAGATPRPARPEPPLASESIPSPSPLRFRSHRAQFWLAGIFGALLLIAFVTAILSRPDTSALRNIPPAVHQVLPRPPSEPEPEPEPEPVLQPTEIPADPPTAEVVEAPPPPQPSAAAPPSEPRKPPRRAKANAQPPGVRPRVELRPDDFGGRE